MAQPRRSQRVCGARALRLDAKRAIDLVENETDGPRSRDMLRALLTMRSSWRSAPSLVAQPLLSRLVENTKAMACTHSTSLRILRALVASALASTALLASAAAHATPGTHPPVVATWDTTASSINGAFHVGWFPGGRIYFASYNSSFSSTSGNLSAQFGLHYADYQEAAATNVAYGAAGTASLVYSAPLLHRYPTGLPVLAFGFDIGIAPTFLISGEYNYIWLPVTLGVAAPYSPLPFLTFTPWGEVAGGATFDSVIRSTVFTSIDPNTIYDPVSHRVNYSQSDINRLVKQAIQYELLAAISLRAGLSAAVHLGRTFDLGATTMIGNIGTIGEGHLAVFAGGYAQIHWDHVVPAVLPAEERLRGESCDDVEQRFKTCPDYAPQTRRPPPVSAPTTATPATEPTATPATEPTTTPATAPEAPTAPPEPTSPQSAPSPWR